MDPFVQVLLDEREITKLLHRYAMAIDQRDWDLLRTCFLDDAVASYGSHPDQVGYEAIEHLCRTLLVPLSRSHHLIGNVFAVVDGQEATAECYLQAQHVREGTAGGELFLVAGRYTDNLVRTEDGWRIATRRLEVWWTQGNRAVMEG